MESSPSFQAFGDESAANLAVTYGLVVVPEIAVRAAEEALAAHKAAAGGPPTAPLHCRELFHERARAKTQWAHLSDEGVFALYSALAGYFMATKLSKCFVGWIDKTKAPKVLLGDENFPATKLGNKQLAAFAYYAATMEMTHTLGDAPIRIQVDPDRTKIQWFGRNRQAGLIRRIFWDPSQRWIEPERIGEKKPALLEIADLLAYTSARALSPQSSPDKQRFVRLYRLLSPRKGTFVFGGAP